MSKNKRKGGKNSKRSRLGTKSIGENSISSLAYWLRRFTIFTTLLAVLIWAFTALQTSWYSETPLTTKWGMVMSMTIITGIRFRELFRGYKNNSYRISKRSAIFDTVLAGLLLVIVAVPVLIGTGTIEELANWVYSITPLANRAISKIIAWILTFAIPSAVSGVIGNYVYDLLKKIYSSKERND
jgi:hypothetical protein